LLLTAMLLLVQAGRSVTVRSDVLAESDSSVVHVLDGLVAAIAFAMFVVIAGFTASAGHALPRSESTTVVFA
jgi:hypothetical protein